MALKIERFDGNPLITPEMGEGIGGNINGPSLIRVPDWVENSLGKYYLYFAHHQGKFIRMAYADDVRGPYTVHSPGVLDLEDTVFLRHIASPDVHIDGENQVIYMYYHGAGAKNPHALPYGQMTCYAESKDGLCFKPDNVYLGPSYMRVFAWDGAYHSFSGGGGRNLLRSEDRRGVFGESRALQIVGEGFTDLSTTDKKDPEVVIYRVRHVGVHLRGHELDIYYSNVGDDPERIKRTTVDLRADRSAWQGSAPVEVLQTEMAYEGVNEPLVPSNGGASHVPVHQVRDPALYEEDGRLYLIYSVAGESGLAGAELIEEE